ncbi:MAG: SOS response-associated peptidase family protein [Leptospiraceae bacterium]|nr:SOS response-associated peptidase family protein [Leptospiraceae bacterium]
MCSRFSLKSKMQELQEQFQTHNIIEDMDFKDEFLPTDRILVIWRNTEIDQNEMKLMRWGLIPNFVKDFEQIKKYSLFNARSKLLKRSQRLELYLIQTDVLFLLIFSMNLRQKEKLKTNTHLPYTPSPHLPWQDYGINGKIQKQKKKFSLAQSLPQLQMKSFDQFTKTIECRLC